MKIIPWPYGLVTFGDRVNTNFLRFSPPTGLAEAGAVIQYAGRRRPKPASRGLIVEWTRMKLQRILLICALIVGIPLVAYAIGVPDKYIQGLFLLLLLIYLVPLALNTYSKRSRQDRDE
jgi:hypothetical protein